VGVSATLPMVSGWVTLGCMEGRSSIQAGGAGVWEGATWSTRSAASMNDVAPDEDRYTLAPRGRAQPPIPSKTLRFRLLSAPARLVTHARRKILKVPPGWAWATDLAAAWNRLQALHPD